MSALWASTSYEPHLLSLPFAFAPAAMLVVVAYGLVMRGEPVLRAWMLVHFLALLPYSVVMMLSPSIVSHDAAEALFRIAAASIPLAAAAGAGFQFRALGMHRQAKWYVWFGVVVGAAWIVACVSTDTVVEDVRRLPVGLWYANAGSLAWLTLVSTVVVATPGFIVLARRAITAPPSVERRQLRLVLIANAITYAGLTDVALAYEIGVFPLGWLLSGVGSVLVARALVVEDLLRVRAVDTTAPRIVLHLASAILLGWVALHLLGDAPWWMVTLVLAVSFMSVRVTLAVIALIARGARGSEDTLDRLLGQLTARARPLEKEPAIATLGVDVIELGVGVRVEIMIAASDDYGWTTGAGDEIADDAAPDPLLGAWLAEHARPIFAAELDAVPEDLRGLVKALLDKADSRALFPVANQDELLALVLVPAAARRMRRRELTFIERAADRLGEALVHARMAQRAAERAMIARQVELAATLQQQLLPGREPHVHGDITIVGSWLPATRCAGDFWGVYPLGARGVLVAIGDVTGHGVASATVTAAAAAAVDVVVRRSGEALELGDLVTAIDAAVHRVGGGQLSMTCFAAILDAKLREVSFVSCGHTTPYLCRTGERGELELQALVGRGNPLGTSQAAGTKVLHKPLKAGDLVVWYTDGVIEAQDSSGEPFGDRRLQRMLRRLDRGKLTPAGVHDVVYASVATHRGSTPRADDETLVVAQWAPPPAASTEPSREAAT
jgi:serine phosphatase RsbU (regulator of sigma subunit)